MNQKIFKITVFLGVLFFAPIFASADESSITVNENTSSLEQSNQPFETMSLDISQGLGTANAPFLVSTIDELKTAIASDIVSGESAIYIKLTADIIYSDIPVTIKQNIVLDGDNHYILYSGTNYTTAHFWVGDSNLDITFKNIKYGNDVYPNNNYYGILYIGGSYHDINFNVENIDYNIQKGAQPFYANGRTNTLTLKGKNSFKGVTSNGASGEFSEGFTAINFSDDSQTTIYNDTASATAVFWGPSNQNITVGKNALVDISTSKQYLSYDGNLTLNVEEKGQFLYRAISGSNHATNVAALKASGAINMSFAKDAIGHFTTDKNGFSGSNPSINVSSPNYVMFDASSPTTSVLNALTPNFIRNDSDGEDYTINYLMQTGQMTLIPNVTSSQNVSAASINKGYSVVYARSPKISDLNVNSETGTDLSQITAQIIQWTPESITTGSQISYKLSKNRLYTQSDLNSSAAQDSIENDTSVPTQVINVTIDVKTDSVYQYQNLPAQMYYIYSKLENKNVPGYTLVSPWVEKMVEIKPYIEVSLPDVLTFESLKSGTIVKNPQLPQDFIVNHGNVPINLNLKTLTIQPDSSSVISLVPKVQGTNQLQLQLVSDSVLGGGEQLILGPLLAGPISTQAIRLSPYWESDREAALYLNGEHSVSGLIGGPYQVHYNLKVAVNQAKS